MPFWFRFNQRLKFHVKKPVKKVIEMKREQGEQRRGEIKMHLVCAFREDK